MTTLKQSLSVNGQEISNNDPDMVIKLDDHAVVQIASIQDDSITYSFAGRVNEPVVINLNLTFTYKGTNKLVVPLTFTQNATKPEVVTGDVPLTVTMWEIGSTMPLTVEIEGQDVSDQISGVHVADNDYVKAYQAPGSEVVQWRVMYAEEQPVSKLIPFDYSVNVGGKLWAYNSQGTFRLPAWEGVAYYLYPFAENDPEFTKLRIKKGSSETVELDASFMGVKGVGGEDKTTHVPEQDVTGPGAVEFTVGDYVVDTGRPITVKAVGDTGIHQVKLALAAIDPGLYPEQTPPLSLNFWNVEVEIWDDALTVEPTVTSFEGAKDATGTIVPNIKLNGTAVAPNADGVVITFSPEGIITKGQVTDTGIEFTFAKDVDVTTEDVVDMTIAYSGKSVDTKLDIKTIKQADSIVVTPIPQNVEVWDVGTGVPFTVELNGTDVTSEITDVAITENTYVRQTDTGWEVYFGEWGGHTEDVVYTFKVPTASGPKDATATVSFVIGAYKGIFLGTISPANLGGQVGDKGTFEIALTYKTKDVSQGATWEPTSNLSDNLTLGEVTYEDGKMLIPYEVVAGGYWNEVFEFRHLNDPDVKELTGEDYSELTLIVYADVFGIELEQESNTVIDSESNHLYFKLTDGQGNPITNAEKVDLDITEIPKNKFVVRGYSGGIYKDPGDEDGRYYCNVNAGEVKGTFTIKVKVKVPGKTDSYQLPDMTYNNPGTPVIATPEVNDINVALNEVTELRFTLTQSVYLTPNKPAIGRATITSVIGAGELAHQANAIQPDGTYEMGLKSTGVAGTVNIKGTWTWDSGGTVGVPTDFEFAVEYVEAVDLLKVVSQGDKIVGGPGDTGSYPIELTWKGQPLPTETPGINGSVRPGGSGVLTVTPPTADGLGYMLNGMIHPGKIIETQDTVILMYGDEDGTMGDVDIIIPIQYVSPSITINGIPPQSVKLNDVVVFDPRIDCGDWTLTDDWTSVELMDPNDYIEIAGKGFKVIKVDAEQVNRSVDFKFIGNFEQTDGTIVQWEAIKVINITIAANVSSDPVITDPTTELELALWETKPVAYKVMVGSEDITSTSTVELVWDEGVDHVVELVKVDDTTWGLKGIKADPLVDTTITAKLNVTGTHNETPYTLPLQIAVKVLANTSGIPANRFNIEFM